MSNPENQNFSPPEPDGPLPPPLKTTRVVRFYDVSRSMVLIAVLVVVAVSLSAALWTHPRAWSSLVSSLTPSPTPGVPVPVPQPSPKPPVDAVPPAPDPKPPQEHTGGVKPAGDRLRREEAARDQTLDARREQELKEIRAQAEKDKHDLEIREQLAKDAELRAQKLAEAERADRERAEAAVAAARNEQAEAERRASAARAEKDRFESAEMTKQREAAAVANAEAERIRNYSGPRFGTLVWEGDVQGAEMITVENGTASMGAATGLLPGIPAFIQPLEPNKVGIVGMPAPSNRYRAMTFRVKGKGHMKLTFRWSIQ